MYCCLPERTGNHSNHTFSRKKGYILGHMGLLRGITATCFEGFETQLTGANYSPQHVCCDQNVITARGAGVSVEFALKLVEVLCGASKANLLRKSIQCM